MLHVDSAFAWSALGLPMWMYTAFPLRVMARGDFDKRTCSGRCCGEPSTGSVERSRAVAT